MIAPDRRGTHVPAVLGQGGRQLRATLAGPAQRRPRIASGDDDRLQGRGDAWLAIADATTAGPGDECAWSASRRPPTRGVRWQWFVGPSPSPPTRVRRRRRTRSLPTREAAVNELRPRLAAMVFVVRGRRATPRYRRPLTIMVFEKVVTSVVNIDSHSQMKVESKQC